MQSMNAQPMSGANPWFGGINPFQMGGFSGGNGQAPAMGSPRQMGGVQPMSNPNQVQGEDSWWDSIRKFFLGQNAQVTSHNIWEPEQRGLVNFLMGNLDPSQFQLSGNPLYQQGESYLKNLLSGNPETFRQMQQPQMDQFNQEILPSIAERYIGGSNLRNNSGFNQAATKAGQNLQSQLSSQQMQAQMAAVPHALSYAQAPGDLGSKLAQIIMGSRGSDTVAQNRQSGILEELAKILPNFWKPS